MCRLRSAVVCGWLFLCMGPAPASAATAAPAAPQNLILEVWINGQDTNALVRLVDRGGRWWASRSDLLDAGINVNIPADHGLVPLAGLDGIVADIDQADQRLIVHARPDCLAPQRIDLRQPAAHAEPSSTTGLVGSYDFTATTGDFNHSAQTSGVDAALGATLFAPLGTLTMTGFAQTLDGANQAVRLDTTAEWDQPDLLRRLLLGDAVSGGLAWSRSVRFGGVQLATDFTLQPGLTTFPLPAFFGQTAVPSSVDVFVNSARVFEGDVSPGPFQINDLPTVTGGGQATVVVRNVLGQEMTQTFSFYASDLLLQQGLSAYDVDLGFLREAYGEESFDYGAPLATGTYRYGVSDWLTLEAHAETAADVQLLGAGGAFTVGSFGVISGDVAASNNRLGQGELYSASFESQSQPFGVFGSVSATDGGYVDLASIGGTPPPRLRTQLGANLSFEQNGAIAASWIGVKEDGESATQLISASYTLSFNGGWYFSATGLHDCGNGTWAGEIALSIPIGSDVIATASAQAGAHANDIEAAITRPTDPDGGFGYNVSASAGDIRSENGEATWIGDRGTLDGAISSVDGQTAARLSASGAVVEMNGEMFAARTPQGAVALVQTGLANVPVYLENRQVAVADADGEALLTNLTSDASNRISIEPTDYSFATVVTTTQQTVVPRRQSGVLVDLAPPRSRPVLVSLQGEDGNAPPAGSSVSLSTGGATLLVGHGGQVFIADLEQAISGTVSFPGGSCRFHLEPLDAAPADSIPRVGPVLCEKVPQ